MAKFMGENGLLEARLSGGESTSHPNFVEIMQEFKKHNVYVSVATNGLWNKRVKDALSAEPYLWVIVSVDGGCKTHNKYRPGTYDKIKENLLYLKKYNPSARIRINTVLTQENKDDMLELSRFGAEVQVESLNIIPLRPQLRDTTMISKMVTADQLKHVTETLVKGKQIYGTPFSVPMETNYKPSMFPDPIVRKHASCPAGREATNIDYDDAKRNQFLVYGCSYSPASDLFADQRIRKPFIGGIYSPNCVEEFLNIWRDEKSWNIYRNLENRSHNCSSCSFYQNKQCTGSCPIQNIRVSDLNPEQDIEQQFIEQIKNTPDWYCRNNKKQQVKAIIPIRSIS